MKHGLKKFGVQALACLAFTLAWSSVAFCDEKTTRCKVAIEINERQPADAPVIFSVVVTNKSDKDVVGEFYQNVAYKVLLTSPDGKTRRVRVTNGSRLEGSYMPTVTLKPKESHTTPLRLTNASEDGTDYIPSEQVYLSPGSYVLRVELKGSTGGGAEAFTETKFEVHKDSDLAKARFDELRSPPKGREEFANHVLATTLTPELRKQWYEQIKDSDPSKAAYKVYALNVLSNPPPEVGPAILEAIKVHVENPNVENRDLCSLLNNAAHTILDLKPSGAGETLLRLATSNHDPNARTPAIEALRFYYEDSMTPKLVQLLRDPNRWVRIYTAWLLAWAGDDHGVGVLVEATAKPELNGSVFAAGALSYLPDNKAAAEALKKAIGSSDIEFTTHLKKYVNALPPPRKKAN